MRRMGISASLSGLIPLFTYIWARDMRLRHLYKDPHHGMENRGNHPLSVVKYSSIFITLPVVAMEQITYEVSFLLFFSTSKSFYIWRSPSECKSSLLSVNKNCRLHVFVTKTLAKHNRWPQRTESDMENSWRICQRKKMVQNFKFVAQPCSKHLAIIAISSGPLSCLQDMPPVDSFWTGRLTT